MQLNHTTKKEERIHFTLAAQQKGVVASQLDANLLGSRESRIAELYSKLNTNAFEWIKQKIALLKCIYRLQHLFLHSALHD